MIVGRIVAASAAIARIAPKNVIPTARPRRLTPCASSHSTAGFSASARKTATPIQIRTPCGGLDDPDHDDGGEDDPEHDENGARAEVDEPLLHASGRG